MKKNSAKGYAVLGILFVLISVVAFVVPTAKTAAFCLRIHRGSLCSTAVYLENSA